MPMSATQDLSTRSVVRPSRSRFARVLPRSLALAAVIAGAVLSSRSARAEIQIGAEAAAPVSLDSKDRGDRPAFLGQAALRIRPADGPFVFGVTIGQQRQSFQTQGRVSGGDTTLTVLLPGAGAQYYFLKKDWDAYPFLGIDAGYAQARLARPTGETTDVTGFFVAPQAGLAVPLGKYVLFAIELRYQGIVLSKKLVLNDANRTRNFGGLGLGGGLYATF